MPIHFRCPHCDKLLAIGTGKAGTQLACPLCAQILKVPARTEVHLPTTTVVPPVEPPSSEADAWWLTTPSSVPAPAANTITNAAEPSAPPPLSDAAKEPLPLESPAIASVRSFTRMHVFVLAAGLIVAAIGGMVILLLTRTRP